jgi:hypothetical protein
MKKILLSLVAVALLGTANAQISFAPELGLNLANMSIKSGGTSMSTSMKAGLAVGGIADIGFTDNLSLQPGIFYVMNGCNFSGGSYNVGTIQVPINVIYKLGEEGGNRFFFGAGPFIGFNMSAKAKAGSTSTTIDIGTDKTKDGLKPLDFGVGVNLGYMLANGLFFRAHYQMGLANLDPISDADNTAKSSAVGVTAGYFFGKKGKKMGHKR